MTVLAWAVGSDFCFRSRICYSPEMNTIRDVFLEAHPSQLFVLSSPCKAVAGNRVCMCATESSGQYTIYVRDAAVMFPE